MLINNNHLSYCTNIHNYTTAEELIDTVYGSISQVAKSFSKQPFAVGLHLNGITVDQLNDSPTTLKKLQQALSDNNMYVCSLNCFPHGKFHGEPVKEKVYHPDWGTELRTNYTIKAATILEQLLPDGVSGTISTVPLGYGKTLPHGSISNIIKVSENLQKLSKKITLTFEPEPDCYLDCIEDCIIFFNLLKIEMPAELLQFVGVCLDTCHFSVLFQSPAEALMKLIEFGINVPKIQISAALKTKTPETLEQFCEPIYLHQTAIKHGEIVYRYPDLDQALKKHNWNHNDEWRVHFHVPIYFPQINDKLSTTANELKDVLKIVNKISDLHLEVETYSFNVIPDNNRSIVNSIVEELSYTISMLSETE